MTAPPRGVLLVHAGRQHSARSAVALERAGLLAGYWSGVPLAGPLARPVLGVELPAARLAAAPWAPGLRKLVELLAPGRARAWGDYLANRLFDRWAARRAEGRAYEAVIGFETGCARLFAAARAAGAVTVLEAPSLHHASQDRWRAVPESLALHRRICATKDRELANASHVVVASELAAASYRAAGFDASRIRSVPLGVDLDRFPRGPGGSGTALAVLFAGKVSAVKGLDLLLAALEIARDRGAHVALRVAGQGSWPSQFPPGVVHGTLSPRELAAAYGGADVLVLPSRFDGYGLVVPESLACGTPVIVSDRVGAQDLVERDRNGWIVPAGDVAALAERLVWCASHLDRVRSMRAAAAESARSASWDLYYQRYAGVIRSLLDAGRP